MDTPTNKAARFIKNTRRCITVKPNLQLLKDDNIVNEKFSAEIRKYLAQHENPRSLDEMRSRLVKALDNGKQKNPSTK